MVVLDISDLPVFGLVAQSPLLPRVFRGMAAQGEHVYVADESGGLQIVDFSNMGAPVIAGTYVEPQMDYRDVAVLGAYAYLADRDRAVLDIIDISDPRAPSLVGRCSTLGSADAIAVAADRAYLATWAGLEIYDVGNPAAPYRLSSSPCAGADVDVSGGYAYVATFNYGLVIVDVRNPSTPVRVGACPTYGHQAWGVAVSGSHAYLADGRTGLEIFDVSDPALPRSVGRLDTPNGGSDVAVAGTWAFLADWLAGLHAVDAATPAAPVLRGVWDDVGHAHHVALASDHAYVTGYPNLGGGERGLRILDVRAPDQPQRVADYQTAGFVGNATGRVCLSDAHAYIAERGCVEIVDVSDPRLPQRTAAHPVPLEALEVGVQGQLAYVAARTEGLMVLDVAEPTAPVCLGEHPTTGEAWCVAIASGHAYVGTFDGWLDVFSLANPGAPIHVDAVHASGRVKDVTVNGGYAYIAADSAGLDIFTLTDPASPAFLANVRPFTEGQSYGVAQAGHYAFLQSSYGVYVINVEQPSVPELVTSWPAPGWAYDLALNGGYLYIADEAAGILVLAVYNPADLNCDGHVDFADINPFVLSLSDPAAYRARYPSCHLRNADLNSDGCVDFRDINPFVAALSGSQ
ncbi:MAG: hypothetical protein AB1716_09520 [Planctomycetota bacterium]